MGVECITINHRGGVVDMFKKYFYYFFYFVKGCPTFVKSAI